MKVLTTNQRDLVALYCLHMGIHTPSNIKKQIEQYEEIRDIVNLCCEELEKTDERKHSQEGNV